MNDRTKPRPISLRDRVGDFLRWRESDEELREGIALRLQELIDADSLSGRLAAWGRLTDWARSGPGSSELNEVGMLAPAAIRRWTLLLDFLDANPDLRAGLQTSVAEILSETEGVNLFGAAGVPSGRGFIAELGDRVVGRLLPAPRDEHDLAKLLTRLYRTKGTVERFARLPPEFFSRLADLLRPPGRPEIWSSMRRDFADGFRLLAARMQNEGLAPKLRARGPAVRVDQSPFFLQQRAADALLLAWSDRCGRWVRGGGLAARRGRLPRSDGGSRAPARDRRRQRRHRLRSGCDRSLPRPDGIDGYGHGVHVRPRRETRSFILCSVS